MKIKMAGIDFSRATLSQREIFAFSSKQAQEGMRTVIHKYEVDGCIIVSTCNRTEIWVCAEDFSQIELPKILCELKQVDTTLYRNTMIVRDGMEAVQHLFETACGLHSQIWGEDQILTQIKQALETARDVKTPNEVLGKLFQTAITAAKKVKSTVRLTAVDVSAASKALEIICQHFSSIHGLNCLVLGNGEMGRMVSSMLISSGAKVTVTLREYRHKMCVVPEGCTAVNYEKRLEHIQHSDVIISATTSPHFTIKYEEVCHILTDYKDRMFIDLAVPRDIDPQIASINQVYLFDMESLGGATRPQTNNRSLIQAQEILEEYMIDFLKWKLIRETLPILDSTVNEPFESIDSKLKQDIKRLSLQTKMGILFENKVISVTSKSIRDILFKIKNNTKDQYLEECLEKVF